MVDQNTWQAGGWASSTNNAGELTAVLELFNATAAAGLADQPLHILADSQYAINCVTKWLPGWKKRGWKKADGKPVANREILEEIDRAIAGRQYRFEWVRGHTGNALNELADDRAREAATAYQKGALPNPGPGFTGEASVAVLPPEPQNPGTIGEVEAREAWSKLLDQASLSPVTITRNGGTDLVLLDAETARRALALLAESEADQTLF